MKSRPAIGVGLMLMSFGAGCVDVLSYRSLGEVFPSAMTGNVALMGLSLGQGDVLGAARNLVALGSFFSGLLLGAFLLRGAPKRARFILTLALQAALLLAFALLWDRHGAARWRYGLIGLAAVGMGLQSAVAFRIGVTGVSTTYFTGTLTNIAFRLVEPHWGEPAGSRRVGWPMLAFFSYLSGALTGGWSLAGLNIPDLPIGLPALPLATTVILGAIIAIVRPDQSHGS
jgi:uncharacterized membrane protein YoaK (UPF0700 family)